MARVFSFITFPASDKFKNERDSHISTLQGIITTGMLSSYHGLQVAEEGGKTGYLVSVWNDVEALNTFQSSNGAKFGEILSAVSTGETQRYRFAAVGSRLPTPVVNSKTSEFIIIKPKGGASADAVKAAALKLSDVVDSKGYAAAVGEAVDGGVFMMGVGGQSFADFENAKKDEGLRAAIGELRAIADLEITHANLNKET